MLWTLVPPVALGIGQLAFLPGERANWFWGALLLVVPCWCIAGLTLFAVELVRWRFSTRSLLLTPCAFLLGISLFFAVRSLPPAWTLGFPVHRAFAKAQLVGDIVRIEGGADFDGHGNGSFVREVERASTSTHGILRIAGHNFEIPRRCTEMVDGVPLLLDYLLAYPVRDGWWYVYVVD